MAKKMKIPVTMDDVRANDSAWPDGKLVRAFLRDGRVVTGELLLTIGALAIGGEYLTDEEVTAIE
jgi:hypothetical protein